MGCLNSKYSPHRNAERRLKGEKEDATKSLTQNHNKDHSYNRFKEKIERVVSNEKERDNSNSEIKGVARNDNKSDEVGENVPQRSQEKKIIVANSEFVEGWPKWLVDNIPPNVLDSLVPKSADSYEKLGKVDNIMHF